MVRKFQVATNVVCEWGDSCNGAHSKWFKTNQGWCVQTGQEQLANRRVSHGSLARKMPRFRLSSPEWDEILRQINGVYSLRQKEFGDPI
jgi:hypothetical protein